MKNRILIIDSQINESRKLKLDLESKGYDVLISKSFEEGLLIINANNIDLIFVFNWESDIERIKNNKISSHIPIIGILDIPKEEQDDDFIRFLSDSILKPYKSEELFSKINQYIKVKELEEQLRLKEKEIEHLHKQLKDFSLIDKETGIYNSFYLKHVLIKECEKAKRYAYNLSAFAFSIDNLPSDEINSLTVIKELVSIIEGNIRKGDIFARIDKSLFYVLLPYTGLKEALFVAEKVRKKVDQYKFKTGDKTTLSIGVTIMDEIDRAQRKEDEIINRAKESLEKAIKKGGNNIECC